MDDFICVAGVAAAVVFEQPDIALDERGASVVPDKEDRREPGAVIVVGLGVYVRFRFGLEAGGHRERGDLDGSAQLHSVRRRVGRLPCEQGK